MRVQEILKAINGKVLINKLDENIDLPISTDTRTIFENSLYIPLKGANFDGENFIQQAIEKGAIAYFTSKDEIIDGAKLVVKVDNTLFAYMGIAREKIRRVNPKVIAVTGSSGKTTTKEIINSVVLEKFKTHKTALNYNNEIGFCQTVMSMPEDTEVLILEMGMRGLGEIDLLAKYAQPHISVITNVGTAHIGRLGSRENIAKAKCEIANYLKSQDYGVFHNDNLINSCVQDLDFNKIYYSIKDVNVIEREVGKSVFDYNGEIYELSIEGDYNIENSLSAINIGKLLGLTYEEIARGLKSYKPIEKRWQVENIAGYQIINDSYNANPESVKAAVSTVFDLYKSPTIILGDMGELGDNSASYHSEIGQFINAKCVNAKVLTVGVLAKNITDSLNSVYESLNFVDNTRAANYIVDNIAQGSTLFFKASRSMKFEEIIEKIKILKGESL